MITEEIFNQFKELKSKIQTEALNNNDLSLFTQLSQISDLFLDYGCEKYKEGLDSGIKIVKESYKL